MTDVLDVTGRAVAEYVAGLAPHDESRVPVAWAGEARSENWMDIGREYTERWHHQMQIRDAVGAAPLLDRRWFEPLMSLSVRAFRRSFADVSRAGGGSVVFGIRDQADLVWTVARQASGWDVQRGRHGSPDAVVTMQADDAWRLLYNALSEDAARSRSTVEGDPGLVATVFRTRAVMV
jgi:hypothetical protein